MSSLIRGVQKLTSVEKALAAYGVDAFVRQRVSEPQTLLDISQLWDDRPELMNTLEANGGTATHSVNTASTKMAVTTSAGSRVVRQSRRYCTYQPGKSLLIKCTGVLIDDEANTGVRTRMGYFDEHSDKSVDSGGDGIFVQWQDGTVSLNKRSYVTGSQSDSTIAQSSWNLDKLDGSGPSGKTLDPTKSMIFFIDLEWLGVGTVACGFIIDRVPYYVHYFHHANLITGVYMRRATLPIRYEIEQITGANTAEMEQICATVISEGGHTPLSNQRSFHMSTPVTMTATEAPILAIKPKTGYERITYFPTAVKAAATTNDSFIWRLYAGGSLSSGTYSSVSQEMEASINPSGYTLGRELDGGYISSQGRAGSVSQGAIDSIGSEIDGTPDLLVVTIQSLSGNVNCVAGMTWQGTK